MFFGEKLKELRLKHARLGSHKFADKIQMSARFYSEMERGFIPPPCKNWIYGLLTDLNLECGSTEAIELHDLWAEPFVMQKMDEDVAVSLLTHKSDGTPLTIDEHISLNEHINSIGKNIIN